MPMRCAFVPGAVVALSFAALTAGMASSREPDDIVPEEYLPIFPGTYVLSLPNGQPAMQCYKPSNYWLPPLFFIGASRMRAENVTIVVSSSSKIRIVFKGSWVYAPDVGTCLAKPVGNTYDLRMEKLGGGFFSWDDLANTGRPRALIEDVNKPVPGDLNYQILGEQLRAGTAGDVLSLSSSNPLLSPVLRPFPYMKAEPTAPSGEPRRRNAKRLRSRPAIYTTASARTGAGVAASAPLWLALRTSSVVYGTACSLALFLRSAPMDVGTSGPSWQVWAREEGADNPSAHRRRQAAAWQNVAVAGRSASTKCDDATVRMRKRSAHVEKELREMLPWTVEDYVRWCQERGQDAAKPPDATNPAVSKRAWEKSTQAWRHAIKAWRQEQERVEHALGR